MSTKARLQEGIQLLQEGDLDASRDVFKSLVEEDKQDARALLWLGNNYVMNGDLSHAREAFRGVIRHDKGDLREEAKRQLRSLWFNRFVYHLILQPPLRYLLILSMLGYGVSFGLLQFSPYKEAAQMTAFLSIWVVLPIFFSWVIFIFAYFVGNIAFAPAGAMNPKAARSAKLAVALAGIFVIPANLFMHFGLGVKVLAVFLDVFLLSLAVSQVINRLGQKLAGEESVLILHQLARAGAATSFKNNQESTNP